MLWRSAPEAKSTVAPRRAAGGWQAGEGHRPTSSAGEQTSKHAGRYLTGGGDGEAGDSAPWRSSLLRRALSGAAVVFGVLTLMFFLLRLAPGDPARLLVGPAATEEQVDGPAPGAGPRPAASPAQYATWLGRFVRGDWGTSIATGRPVRRMLAEAWPATVRLVGISLVLSYLIGIAVGVLQAMRGGRLDTALSVATVTLFALPGYWLGLMLVMVFTYQARLLPAFGAAGFDADFLTGWDRVADRLRHLALPLATLTLIGIGGTARFVRGAMLDVAGAPFVAIARAKGLSPTPVAVRHVLRNALIPVVTLLGLSLPALFSGAVFIEAIFAWPGVGRVLVEGVAARDYPVIMAATAVSAALVVAGNLLAEALVGLGRPAGPRRRARRACDVSRGLWRDRRAAFGLAVLALAVLVALLRAAAWRATRSPSATSWRPGSCPPRAPTPPARSTCSAPTASAGTSGPGWPTAPACRSASGRWRCWCRWSWASRSARRRGSGGAGRRRCCSGSPTSPSRCPAWCCCCCSPRCGSRARGW